MRTASPTPNSQPSTSATHPLGGPQAPRATRKANRLPAPCCHPPSDPGRWQGRPEQPSLTELRSVHVSEQPWNPRRTRARVHAHVRVWHSAGQACGCGHPSEAWFQSVTSQLSLPSGGPSQIKFSLRCCFSVFFLSSVSPSPRAPAETRGTRKEGERGRVTRAWGGGLSPQGRLRQLGTSAMGLSPSAACWVREGAASPSRGNEAQGRR